MHNIFGTYALENSEDKKAVSTALIRKNFFGKVIESPEEARKVVRNAAIAASIFGSIALLAGLANHFMFLDAAILLGIAYALQKQKSRIGAVTFLLYAFFGLIIGIFRHTAWYLLPLVTTYFSYRSVQGTFALHALADKPANKNLLTPPPPPPSLAA